MISRMMARTFAFTSVFALTIAALLTIATVVSAQKPTRAVNQSELALDTEDAGWTQLFNGKDLTGWKISSKSDPKMKWEVQDGLLVGSGNAGMLFSEGGDYENFHFRIEAKINDKGNSGQYFRCTENPGFTDGYEAQLNATHRDPIKTGSLYKFPKTYVLNDAPHKPDEFFTQEVIAEGNHIQILVNGKKLTDIVDDKNTFMKGHFTIQQHDPGSKITLRKIEVKRLPASKPTDK